MAAISLVFATASSVAASQSATWGWATDTDNPMSFFFGIPYAGCERATLTVPNSGSTGTVTATTRTSIVIGPGAQCSGSNLPSSLNAFTLRTRAYVLRNGYLVVGCSTPMVYNSSGQGVITASTGSNCQKTSSADATWTVRGVYGWWDYDDARWRSETVNQPAIAD